MVKQIKNRVQKTIKGPHERRKIGEEKWSLVAIVRWLWPCTLLLKIQAGETVKYDGYEWRKQNDK
jgi:hypothetical protein